MKKSGTPTNRSKKVAKRGDSNNSAISKETVDEDKRLMAYYRKENERLQNLIAKNQVAHESETNKIRAEAANKAAPMFSVTLNGNGHKTSGGDKT